MALKCSLAFYLRMAPTNSKMEKAYENIVNSKYRGILDINPANTKSHNKLICLEWQ